MIKNIVRKCPICDGMPKGLAFPFQTVFNNITFKYYKCKTCRSVYVDPIPDDNTLAVMYSKSDYHDHFYKTNNNSNYTDSVTLLKKYLTQGSYVLDYGCGTGGFLKALGDSGYLPFGVDIDNDAALSAANNASCEAISVHSFMKLIDKPCFDAIHMGDVLEHLPYPAATISEMLGYLKHGGLLYVEGPLEVNPSMVYYVSRAIGITKKKIINKYISNFPPTHLYFIDAKQQLQFINRIGKTLEQLYSKVYETGWPYANNGKIKSCVARLAIKMGEKKILGSIYGNRFVAVYKKL